MKIILRLLTGEKRPIDVAEDATVGVLKDLLAGEYIRESIKLIFQGRILSKNDALHLTACELVLLGKRKVEIPWTQPSEYDLQPEVVRAAVLLCLAEEAVVVPWDTVAIALSMHATARVVATDNKAAFIEKTVAVDKVTCAVVVRPAAIETSSSASSSADVGTRGVPIKPIEEVKCDESPARLREYSPQAPPQKANKKCVVF